MSKKLLAILVLLVVGSVSALTARPAFTAEDNKVGDAVNDSSSRASDLGSSNIYNTGGNLSNPNQPNQPVLPTPTPSCSYKPPTNSNSSI